MPNHGRAAKRRRQHLYLVFDDWLWGLSVRKVDLSANSDSDGTNDNEQVLPDAVICLEAPHEFAPVVTAAIGRRLVVMPLNIDRSKLHNLHLGPWQLGLGKQPTVFDVRRLGITFGPQPTVPLVNPIYIPTVDDRLFVLCPNSFQVLNPPSSVEETDGPSWKGSWCKPAMHPFSGVYISSYVVHPNGTIFVSAENLDTSTFETYTFDTARSESAEWKKRGDWGLPFNGHAHFDDHLNAWVGIGSDMDTTRYICACDLPDESQDIGGGGCPPCKVTKEVLFSEERHEWNVGATLVSTMFLRRLHNVGAENVALCGAVAVWASIYCLNLVFMGS